MIIVKGTSYYQHHIKPLKSPCEGFLFPEPENTFDENAIAIFAQGNKVGYLEKNWMYKDWGYKIVKILKEREGIVRLYKVGNYNIGMYLGLRLEID